MKYLTVLLACLLVSCTQVTDPPPDSRSSLQRNVSSLQEKLRRSPSDAAAWAELGSTYVELARASADPTSYDKARRALDESLKLQPEGNGQAMIGQGALANARHDFAAARDWGMRASAARPSSAEAQGVLVDALTQLGDDEGASVALQRMLDLRPGVSSFTRAAYHFELHGRVDDARAALNRALGSGGSPEEIAFCRFELGELAFASGKLDEALEEYTRADSLQGKGKVAVARGRFDEAVEHYRALVAKVPAPEYLVEYGEALEGAGQSGAEQYDTALRQLRALGGDDLTAAVIAADHGDPAEALRFAQAEWSKRQSVFTADALAWALHKSGRSAEALPYADRAVSLGWRDPAVLKHREAIVGSLR